MGVHNKIDFPSFDALFEAISGNKCFIMMIREIHYYCVSRIANIIPDGFLNRGVTHLRIIRTLNEGERPIHKVSSAVVSYVPSFDHRSDDDL